MKNILLFIALFITLQVSGQTIDGRKNTGLPEKTTVSANDILLIGHYPTGKWYKATYDNVSNHFAEGTYTPTGAAVTNVSTVTPTVGNYKRLGSSVSVWGEVTIHPQDTIRASEITLTLPIASNIAQTYELSGFARNNDTTSIRILGNVAGDKASFKWYAKDTTSKAFSYQFEYKIN
jgi:hypothetical protein